MTANLQPPAVRRVLPSELDRAVGLLSRSFAEDPVLRWALKDGTEFPDALRVYFTFALKQQCAAHDALFVTEDWHGLAAWLPPSGLEALALPPLRLLRLLPVTLQCTGWGRLPRRLAITTAMEDRHPTSPPHWYLYFVGVEQEKRREGRATALLRTALGEVDRQHSPAYLEATNPDAVALYERLRFRVISQFRPRPDAPPLFGMWRDAQ